MESHGTDISDAHLKTCAFCSIRRGHYGWEIKRFFSSAYEGGVQSRPPRTRYIFLYLCFLKRDRYGQNAVRIKTQSVIVLGKCIAFMNHELLVRPCLGDHCKDAVTDVGHVCFFC
jgi:hypothetical protein